MDRVDEILNEIVSICEGLNVPVELDRVLPVQEKQAPMIIVRSGSERLDPPSNARIETLSFRWTIEPSVEVYIKENNPTAVRSEINRIWTEFRSAFFSSELMNMCAQGTIPDLERVVQSPSSDPNIAGQMFDMAFTFIRKNT